MQKKILMIATRQFWPVSSGKEITLYHNCKGLYEKYGYEIYLICFADKNTDESLEKPDFIHEVKYVRLRKIKDVLGSLVKNGLFLRWPVQNAMFYSKRIDNLIFSYYKQIQPDAVFFDMIRLAPYVRSFADEPVRKILIEDDLLAKRYRRQMTVTKGGNISGYLSSSVPSLINKLTDVTWIRNSILRIEAKRLDRYEKKSVDWFDYVTFISPIEMREYNRTHRTEKGITLTVGTNIKYFSEHIPVESHDRSLVIVGNFEYAPNAASIRWIDEEIMPKLPSNVVLNVIGKFPDVLKAEIKSENIHILGYVDDMRYTVKSSSVYLSPIAFGTGIKNKIVEAMAMGMPVVTNSIGAEGLDVQNGRELYIAETAAEIAETVRKLLDDEALRNKLGACGQEYAKKNHDWDVVYEAFSEMGF